jgi:hypothetical protein
MRRRGFIAVFGGAALAWPLTARAAAGNAGHRIPSKASLDNSTSLVTAFRQGLGGCGPLRAEVTAGCGRCPHWVNKNPAWQAMKRASEVVDWSR